MTALAGLERLESPGLWRPGADEEWRDVYLSLGEAELVVQDQGGIALGHWSLPAITRRDAGPLARYVPAEGSDEELRVEEPEMIAALDRVIAAVARGRHRPVRLRRVVTGGAAALALLVAALWLPQALRSHAAGILPPAQRAEIGTRVLAELARRTGPPCTGVTGREALAILKARLLSATPATLAVLPGLPAPALPLPGGVIALSEDVLVAQDDPEIAAGHLLAAALGAEARPPLDRFLSEIGIVPLVRLLSSGRVPDAAIAAHVETLLASPSTLPDADALRPGFAAARLAWAPYAAATDRPAAPPAPLAMPPVLDDAGWQALRGICDR